MLRKIQVVFFLLLATLAANPAVAGTGSAVGEGDPAYEYCLKKGGTGPTFVDSGEYGFCQFSDGGLIDEWTLYKMSPGLGKYRANHSQAVTAFLAATRTEGDYPADGNAGRKNCETLGGSVQAMKMKVRPDVTYFMCGFPDKSMIEEWTLYYGQKHNNLDIPYYPVLGTLIRALVK